MKHCLYIHQDYQPPKRYLYPLDEENLVNGSIFQKFYMQRAIVKPCSMNFMRTF